MVSLSRKLINPIIKTQIPLPRTTNLTGKNHFQFIPFSQLQQIKHLESHLISTLDNCKNLNQLKQTHAHIIRKCLHDSSYIVAKFIRTLSKFEVSIDPYGFKAFSQVKYPNPFVYTALIRGLMIDRKYEEGVDVYRYMRRNGVTPVSFTYMALLKSCSSQMDVDLGKQIHGESMKLGGFGLDLFVGNVLIDMYLKCGWLDCGRKMFDEMPERDLISWTSLIVAYARNGDMGVAKELFDELPVKDMVAWTAMVTGFVQNAKPREAVEYFDAMQKAGIETDDVVLVGVINAFAQLGSSKYADWVRDVADRLGFGPERNVVVGSALIDMYSKCGRVEDAYEVFKVMEQKNVYSYSSMIVGLAIHGRASSALDLFDEMVQMDVKPNQVTFVGVLTACSHAGLVEKGRDLFEMMQRSYNIEPTLDHYNCMVDLLSRAGRLKGALDLIRSMPMEPRASEWGALLGACRKHADPDVAEIAASHLFRLEPDAIGNYILLANVYAKAGRWEDYSRVRKSIRKQGLKKNPAISWVEEKKGVIIQFHASDMTHPRSREIKHVLEDLVDQLKQNGYKPELSSVLYNVSDEEKVRILMSHSEKIALAYGLLTNEDNCAIRIVKNLRICEDCHLFMCGASRITHREIVVRDNMRFHHFSNGTCSCGNFW